ELISPTTTTGMEGSVVDLIAAATGDAVCMIEGFARELPEQETGDAIMEAHRQCATITDAIERLRSESGQGPKELPPASPANPLADELYAKYGKDYREHYLTKGKKERNTALDTLKDAIKAVYLP